MQIKEASRHIARQAEQQGKSMPVPAKDEAYTKQLNQWQQVAKKQLQALKQLESSSEQQKASNENTKILIKCLMIAMRIMAGDEVPKEDHRFLAKYDMGLYHRAISMRIMRENPKKYKRLSEDECSQKTCCPAKSRSKQKTCLPSVHTKSSAKPSVKLDRLT